MTLRVPRPENGGYAAHPGHHPYCIADFAHDGFCTIPTPVGVSGWRVWKFEADDPGGYEIAHTLGLEPFAVDEGWIYWRAMLSLCPSDEDLLAKVEDDRIEAARLR